MKKLLIIFVVGLFVLGGFNASGYSQKIISKKPQPEEYDMVIIAPNKFISQIQPLIVHKNSKNIQTYYRTTESIYNDYQGRDKPEKIKYFIKHEIETYNISYVLLIGGKIGNTYDWYIPVRYVELDDGTARGKIYISDLYYADIYKNGDEFEDWDSNDDDIIAKWPEDKFDLSPDVCIGRLPCRNTNEVETVVEKIISYETSAKRQSWFNNMVVIGGDTFPDYPGYEGEITCDYAADLMQDFDITKLYYSLGTISSSEDVKNAINSGCGFLFTRAKGGVDRIRVPRSDGTEIIALHNDDIKDLTNKDKYPLIVLGECIHGKFDKIKTRAKNYPLFFGKLLYRFIEFLKKIMGFADPINYEQPVTTLNECIAWKLVNKKDGGAIAVLTNTHLCYAAIGDANQNGIPDDVELYGGFLAVETFRLYNQEQIKVLGEIHYKALENYVSTHPVNSDKIQCKSVQEWILFGDPSLEIGG